MWSESMCDIKNKSMRRSDGGTFKMRALSWVKLAVVPPVHPYARRWRTLVAVLDPQRVALPCGQHDDVAERCAAGYGGVRPMQPQC